MNFKDRAAEMPLILAIMAGGFTCMAIVMAGMFILAAGVVGGDSSTGSGAATGVAAMIILGAICAILAGAAKLISFASPIFF